MIWWNAPLISLTRFDRCWSDSVCARLQKTTHSDLNGFPLTDCLWSAHASHPVSVCCRHSIAAAGGGAGRADPSKACAALAWLRLPAGLSSAAEQQPTALCAERRAAALRAQQPAPLVYRPGAGLLRL